MANNTDLINEQRLSDYHDELMKTHLVGGVVFDISAYKASGDPLTPAKFADLTAALGTNGANVPEPMRKGGMSVKFIQSSDNKYVKFFCTADEFTTDATKWQGVDSEPKVLSKNLVESGGVFENTHKWLGIEIPSSNSSYINDQNKWHDPASTAYGKIIPIEAGIIYKIFGLSDDTTIALLKDDDTTAGETPDYCTGYSGEIQVSVEAGYLFTAPADAEYLYVQKRDSGGIKDFSVAKAISVNQRIDSCETEIGDIEASLNEYAKVPYFTNIVPDATKRIREIYISGLDSSKTYIISSCLYTGTLLQIRIKEYGEDSNLCAYYGTVYKGIIPLSKNNNVVGYAVVDIDIDTDTSSFSTAPILNNSVVSNMDYSPTIKGTYGSAFKSGQVLAETNIVNDLTTGGINDVPSAEVTKELKSKIYRKKLSADILDKVYGLMMSTEGKYTTGAAVVYFPVKKDDVIEFKANATYASEYALITTLDGMAVTDPLSNVPYMTGTDLVYVTKNTVKVVNIPEDGYFIYNRGTNAKPTNACEPQYFKHFVADDKVYREDLADYKIILSGRSIPLTNNTTNYIHKSTPNIQTPIPSGTKVKLIMTGIGTYLSQGRYQLNDGSTKYMSSEVVEVTLSSNLTSLRMMSTADDLIDSQNLGDVTAMLVIDDIGNILDKNTSDIQEIKEQIVALPVPPSLSVEDLEDAAGISTNVFTEDFSISVSSDAFKTGNTIINCVAKYTTSDEDIVPTIKVYDSFMGSSAAQSYIVGCKDSLELKQWRFPIFLNGNTLYIAFTIPSGVTLTIESFSITCDDSINRNEGFKFFEHSSYWSSLGFNTKGAFNLANVAGYYGAVVVPKFTTDDVIVCYHDDSFNTENPQLEMIDGSPLPTSSIQTSTFAQVQGMQYINTNLLGEHDRIPTFEEFIKVCAKTGVHPCLSCHPYIDTEAKWMVIKAITDKYHVTDKLTIKHILSYGSTNYQALIFNVFGNSIESYMPDISSSDLTDTITALNSVNWDKNKVKVGVEFMHPTYAQDAINNGGVDALVSEGYVWGVFQNNPDIVTLTDLIGAGCYEWTIRNFFSSGLNW